MRTTNHNLNEISKTVLAVILKKIFLFCFLFFVFFWFLFLLVPYLLWDTWAYRDLTIRG